MMDRVLCLFEPDPMPALEVMAEITGKTDPAEER